MFYTQLDAFLRFALDSVILPSRVLAIVPESLKHSYLRPRGSVGFPWCSNSSGCREGQRPDSLTVGARGTLPGVGIGLRVHGSVGVRLEPGLLALLRVRLQQLPDEARLCGIIERGIHGKGQVP